MIDILVLTGMLFHNIIYIRYLLVECNEGKETKEGAMYLNVMRRFSHALMKVSVTFVIFILSVSFSVTEIFSTFQHPSNCSELAKFLST